MEHDKDFMQRLYLFALEKTQREGTSHEEWVQQAQYLMPTLAEGFGMRMPSGTVPAPAQTMVAGESTTTIQQPAPSPSGFGPAFAGWPEDKLRAILMAAQEAVLARIYGSDEAKHEETRQRYLAALDDLEAAKRAQAK